MGQREEAIVHGYYDAWAAGDKPDVERIVTAFAPDGYWHVLCPTGPVYRGHDELRVELLRQGTFVSKFSIVVRSIASTDNVVLIEHVDSFQRKDVRVSASVMSVFELADDRLIVANRDYFDSADLGGQAGEDTSTPNWMSG